MKRKLVLLAIVLLSCAWSASIAQDWQMKQARIMTPWAEKVDPNNALPEYPRPQLVRSQWLNLNGMWDFTKVEKMEYNPRQTFDKRILVPFAPESALSGIMDTNHNENKGKIFLYNREFSVPAKMKAKDIILHFGAVDWKSEVYVNGIKVGDHKGGFDPFSFNITHALKDKGTQNIQVFVQDYQEYGGGLHGKQKINEKIIWYTPVTGIWQTVWLEPVAKTYVSSLKLVPNIDLKEINVEVVAEGATSATKANIKVKDGKNVVATLNNVEVGKNVAINIKDMKLWSPDSPFLYDLEVELTNNGKATDKVESYFGMRKISIGELNGRPALMLNNEYSFHYGPLDQGFWPDGIYTAPTDEALKFDLEMTKKFGMNMSRKHIKVEPARWYYHCDKMGLLVWQDIPNPGFGENDKIIGEGDLKLRDNFHDEMTRIMKSLENHPSIVMWVVYNEGWGQPDEATTTKGVDLARKLDPNRLISGASGWFDYEIGDIKDTHWYPEPNILPNPVNKRVSVCGEYGGITLKVDNHRWQGGSIMQYTQVYSPEEFTERFIKYTKAIQNLQANGLNAAVYTQITDVEDEENGLMTYDRKVVKVNDEQIARIRKEIEKNYTHTAKMFVENAQTNKSSIWKYKTTDTPLTNKDWTKVDFADKDWKYGKAGFGNGGLQGAPEHTKWTSKYIYLRRTISFGSLTPSELDRLRLQVFHDEDAEIYINGVLAASLPKYNNRYDFVEISAEAKKAIRPNGQNLVAVSCENKEGNQFIDLGFAIVDIPLEEMSFTNEDATVALDAFHNEFFDKDKKIYHAKSDKSGIAAIWTQAIYWDMAINAYKRTGSTHHKQMVEDIYAGNKDHYAKFDWDNGKVWFIYDDIMWWIVSLARTYEVFEKPEYLEFAKTGFERIWSGSPVVKDPGSYDAVRGGMYWQWIQKDPPNRPVNDGKMACINYPTVIAAMTLYNITGDKTYLDRASEIYDWSRNNLFNQQTGAVADSRHGNGEPAWKSQLYNQGTAIGAAMLMYRETKDKIFLNDAILSADYVMNVTSDSEGYLPIRTGIEQGVYSAIFAEYIGQLIREGNQTQYIPWMNKNINKGWANRDKARNLTFKDVKHKAPNGVTEVYDASGIPALMQVVPSIK